MARPLLNGIKPITPAQAELIDSGFRPHRHAGAVRLVRRLLWPFIRPFHFHTHDELAVTAAALSSLQDHVRHTRHDTDERRRHDEVAAAATRAQIEHLARQVDELATATTQSDIARLGCRIDELSATGTATLQSIGALTTMQSRLRSELRAISNRHGWIEQHVAEAHTQARSTHDLLTPRIAELEQFRDDQRTVSETLLAADRATEQTAQNLRAGLADAMSRLEHLIADSQSTHTRVANLEAGTGPTQAQLAGLEAGTASTHTQLAGLDSDRQATATRLSELQNQVTPLQGGLFLTAARDGVFLLKSGELISDAVRDTGVWDAHVIRAAEHAATVVRGRNKPATQLLAIDVGAHFGLITVAIAALFDRVISFEPNTFNVMLLRTNVLLNGLAGKVDVRRSALSARAGSFSLAPNERQEIPLPLDAEGHFAPKTASNLGAYSFVSFGTGLSEAEAIPLDALALDELAFIKIDVQGGDGAVLMGGMETIARCRPWLVFEWEELLSRDFDISLGTVQSRLGAAGYQIRVLHRHNEKQVDYLAVPNEEASTWPDHEPEA